MNDSRYEKAVIAINKAREALKILSEYYEKQCAIKGGTMLEQITNYISDTLSGMSGFSCGTTYRGISLSYFNGKYTIFIKECSDIYGGGTAVASIYPGNGVKFIKELNERMMLTVISDWNGFKEALDFSIKTSLKIAADKIDKEIAHIAYVNEQLAKWEV